MHRPAFEYDWRTRFNLPLSSIGGEMSWAEAHHHTMTLVADPSSQVCASINGWDYPVSQEWLVLRQIHDKFVQGKFRKPFPFLPTPWDPKPVRWGTPLSRDAFDAVLAAHRAHEPSREEAQIRGG